MGLTARTRITACPGEQMEPRIQYQVRNCIHDHHLHTAAASNNIHGEQTALGSASVAHNREMQLTPVCKPVSPSIVAARGLDSMASNGGCSTLQVVALLQCHFSQQSSAI